MVLTQVIVFLGVIVMLLDLVNLVCLFILFMVMVVVVVMVMVMCMTMRVFMMVLIIMATIFVQIMTVSYQRSTAYCWSGSCSETGTAGFLDCGLASTGLPMGVMVVVGVGVCFWVWMWVRMWVRVAF